jgi:ATP adenylyltransferase
MSHIYQPVMLKQLLCHDGKSSVQEIAQALLAEDRSQLEYYEEITKNMVGRVLTSNRGITEKNGQQYALNGFSELSKAEIDELVSLCDAKIDQYLDKRVDPWSHRRKSLGYIPGTLRYEVLKRAAFRCELCGISADHKALEVDHIVPRNHGGTDDNANLQALCYSCNAMKRDRDDADFRNMAAKYQHREPDCAFCSVQSAGVILENALCFAIRDQFPVTPLHTLIIPKRHVGAFLDLYQPELNAAHAKQATSEILAADPAVSGFNIGMNVGEDAGQTVFHAHIYLIPRRQGDINNPRGGVRGVIPSKRIY